MARLSAVLLNDRHWQAQLSFFGGEIGVRRPGPRPHAPTVKLPSGNFGVIRNRIRWKTSGVNKAQVKAVFETSRNRHAEGLEGFDEEDSDSEANEHVRKEGKVLKRITYSREKKLQALAYFENTDMPGSGKEEGKFVPISITRASRTLGID
jgi:hypothetical protein